MNCITHTVHYTDEVGQPGVMLWDVTGMTELLATVEDWEIGGNWTIDKVIREDGVLVLNTRHDGTRAKVWTAPSNTLY